MLSTIFVLVNIIHCSHHLSDLVSPVLPVQLPGQAGRPQSNISIKIIIVLSGWSDHTTQPPAPWWRWWSELHLNILTVKPDQVGVHHNLPAITSHHWQPTSTGAAIFWLISLEQTSWLSVRPCEMWTLNTRYIYQDFYKRIWNYSVIRHQINTSYYIQKSEYFQSILFKF